MKKIFVSAVLLLFCSTLIFAGDIDGKWRGKVDSDMGTFEFTITYKVDGELLSGVMTSEMGDAPFTDGKINGNEFEYQIGIMDFVIKHKGKVLNENEIQITSDSEFGNSEFKMTKVEE